MAWMPGVDASKKATDGNSRLTNRPDIVCIHTIVGYAPALAAHFSTNAGGKIWQHRDTTKQSAANLNGNDHIIAIENEDHGTAFGPWSGSNVPAFTSAQIEAIAKICAWAYKTHGIPLVACPNSKPGSRGIAFHRQGIDGNFGSFEYAGRVAGGEIWSSAFGKICPGDKRIAQIPQIIKRARQIAGLEAAPEGGDDEVSAVDVWGYQNPNVRPIGDAYKYLLETYRISLDNQKRLSEANTALVKANAAIEALVKLVANDADLTVDDVRAAVKEAVKDAVVSVDVNVNNPVSSE